MNGKTYPSANYFAGFALGIAFLLAVFSMGVTRAASRALKQIDQAMLQTVVDRTAKELLIPGAVVLLRTP